MGRLRNGKRLLAVFSPALSKRAKWGTSSGAGTGAGSRSACVSGRNTSQDGKKRRKGKGRSSRVHGVASVEYR